MSKTCFVCKETHLEMISIFQHPEKLDSTLNYLLGLQAKQDDYLCKDCCDEVINTFKSKRKFNQSNAKSLRGDETLFKEESFPGRIEAMISQVPEVKIEQNNEELERSFHELSEGTEPKKLVEQVGTGEDTKQEPVARRSFVNSYKDERDSAKNDEVLKEVALDADLEQISDDDNINCRDKLKAETLSDVEVSSDEFHLNGGKEKIKNSICSSEFLKDQTKENKLVQEAGEEPIVHSNEKSCTAPFTCCSCFKTFITNSKLKRHERIHTGERAYTCRYCSKTFATSFVLSRHALIHTNEKLFECSVCGKSFITSSRLKDHTRIHTEGAPYACSHCPKTFKIKSSLNIHVRRHKKVKSHTCSDCGKGFVCSQSLQRHRTVHTGERPYACHECSKAFSTSPALSRHKRTHTKEKPFECSQCEQTFVNLPSLKKHKRIHTGEIPCLYCTKTFKKSSNHLLHVQTKHAKEVNAADSEKKLHQSNPPNPKSSKSDGAVCKNDIDVDQTEIEISSSEFEREIKSECKDELEDILKTNNLELGNQFETVENVEVCPEEESRAGATIKTENGSALSSEIPISSPHISEMESHKRTHTGEKPNAYNYRPKTSSFKDIVRISHVCSDCGKGFVCSQSLQRHRTVHTGERPYACHECSKAFSTSAALSRHKRTHTKEKPFGCSQCEQTFVNLPNLKKHKRIHTGEIPCLYCSKTFKKSSNHLLHVQTKHAKEVNAVDSEKKLHQSNPPKPKPSKSDGAVHTGEIPCLYCSKTFKKSSNHLLHVQTKHAKEVNAVDSEKKLHQSNPPNPKPSKSDGAVYNNEIDLLDQTEIEISSSEFEVEIKSEYKDELENKLKTNNSELENQLETIRNAEVCP